MTPEQHKAQRDLVLAASLLADTPEERHGVYANRRPRHVPPMPPALPVLPPQGAWTPHAFVLPVVNERRPA